MSYQLNARALERLKALVRAGKYVADSFTFTAADANALLGDQNWTDYANWFLGYDTAVPENTKEHYAFPYGKSGVAYLDALAQAAKATDSPAVTAAAADVLAAAQVREQEKAEAGADVPDILAFNDSHDEKGQFADGSGGGAGDKGEGQKSDHDDSEKLRPAWEKQAAGKSTPKLKKALQDSAGKGNGHPQSLHPMARQIIQKELEKRGAKVVGASATLAITASANPLDRNRIKFYAPVDIKAADPGEDGQTADPTFTMDAYNGGPMKLKGWKYPVVVDLDGVQGLNRNRPALRDHDPSKVIGHTTHQYVQDGSLKAEGTVSGHGPHVDEVVNTSRKGFPWQASIGAKVLQNQFVPDGRTANANGQDWDGPINIARATSLGEISFVALGADDSTSARIAATVAERASAMKFKAWAKAAGFTAEALENDEAMKCAKAAFKAAFPDSDPDDDNDDDDPDTDDDKGDKGDKKDGADAAAADLDIQASAKADRSNGVAAYRKAQAAESKRIFKVREICASGHADIEAKAIEEGWTSEATELAVLRAARPKASPGSFYINTGAGQELTGDIVAASACMAAGVPEKFAFTGLKDNQKEIAASRKVRNNANSIYGLCAIVAAANGVTLPTVGMSDDVIKAMFEIDHSQGYGIRASGVGGFATLSLAGLTENILNRGLLAAYGMVMTVVPDVAFQTDTNDFRQFKRYRMTASGDFASVNQSGELKEMSLQDESYSNQLGTIGSIVNVPRNLLLNDDLGALTQIPTILGRKAAISREKLVFTSILSGKSTVAPGASVGQAANGFNFFSAGAKNYLTGAGSALGIAGVTAAVQTFMQQKDANGDPIMVQPDRLIVPPALNATADNLFQGANLVVSALGSTSSKIVEPNLNAHRNKYRPIASPFFGSQSPVSGGTDTNWLLLADPAGGMAVVTVGYLKGQRAPTIERGESNFNTLGMAMRAFWDIGVSLADFRCGVWSDGQ